MKRLTAGEIRQQSALVDSNIELQMVVITEDNHLQSLIEQAHDSRAHLPASTVGLLREIYAHVETNEEIKVEVNDEDVKTYLDEAGLTIIPVRCYSDSTDRHGNPGHTFKIEFAAVPKT